jgi:hypothetical protein
VCGKSDPRFIPESATHPHALQASRYLDPDGLRTRARGVAAMTQVLNRGCCAVYIVVEACVQIVDVPHREERTTWESGWYESRETRADRYAVCSPKNARCIDEAARCAVFASERQRIYSSMYVALAVLLWCCGSQRSSGPRYGLSVIEQQRGHTSSLTCARTQNTNATMQ